MYKCSHRFIRCIFKRSNPGENAWYAVGIGTAGGGGGTCNTPTGLASSSVTSTSATVSWGAATGALSYNLQYKISTASTWTTVSGITGTSYNLTGLTASTTYNYQVQSVCSGRATSAYSTASSFTTSGSGTELLIAQQKEAQDMSTLIK